MTPKHLEATLVVVINRKTGKEEKRYLINERPSQKSVKEYMTPAVDYFAGVLREVREK